MKSQFDKNFIVNKEGFVGDEQALFFDNEPIEFVPNTWTMIDLLVHVGLFPSKGQARKNWKQETEIPEGFSQFVVGKLKNKITILNLRKSQ